MGILEKSMTTGNGFETRTEATEPTWSLAGGEFDPENSGIDPNAIRAMRRHLLDLRGGKTDDSYKRVLAYETIVYATKLTQPELFEDKATSDLIETEVAQASLKYWSYGEESLKEIKLLADTSTEDLPILRALQIIILELNKKDEQEENDVISEEDLVVSRSKRQLTEGILRALYLEKERPEISLPIAPKIR